MKDEKPTLLEVLAWAALFLSLPVGLMAIGYMFMEIYS